MSTGQNHAKYSFRKLSFDENKEVINQLKLTQTEQNLTSKLQNPPKIEQKDKFNLEKESKRSNLSPFEANPLPSNPESVLSQLEVKDTPVSTSSNTVNKPNFAASSNNFSNKSCAPLQKPVKTANIEVFEDFSNLRKQIEQAEKRQMRDKYHSIAENTLIPLKFDKSSVPIQFSFRESKPEFKLIPKEIAQIQVAVSFKKREISLKYDSFPIEVDQIISESLTEFGLLEAVNTDFYLKSKDSKVILQGNEFLKEQSGVLILEEYARESNIFEVESNDFPIFPANFQYKLTPSRLKLTTMEEKALKSVDNLEIENRFGTVLFEGEVDVSRADFTGFELGLGKFERGNLRLNVKTARVEMRRIIEEYGILADSTYFSEIERQVAESGV